MEIIFTIVMYSRGHVQLHVLTILRWYESTQIKVLNPLNLNRKLNVLALTYLFHYNSNAHTHAMETI